MKKILFFTAIACLPFISCNKEVATPAEKPSQEISSLTGNSVNAVPISEKGTFLIEESVWNSCTGEFIELSGTAKFQVRGMVSDNKITFILHVNYSNVKGVGTTSGTQYVTNSTFNYSNTFNFNTQFVYQQSASTRYVAVGSGLSFTIINDWHLTVNANTGSNKSVYTAAPV